MLLTRILLQETAKETAKRDYDFNQIDHPP